MCLGIPGQVVEITDAAGYLAKVDVNGIKRVISVRLLADTGPAARGDNPPSTPRGTVGVEAGDWVLVHVGFAMAKIDEHEADLTLDQIKKMGQAYTDELDAFKSSELSAPAQGGAQ